MSERDFPWRSSRLATGATVAAFLCVFVSLLFVAMREISLPLGIVGLFVPPLVDGNRGRFLRVDERGVRLMATDPGRRPATLWHVAWRELENVRRDGDRLLLTVETGRERRLRLQGPIGRWAEGENLEETLRAWLSKRPTEALRGDGTTNPRPENRKKP